MAKRPNRHTLLQFVWFNLGGVAFFVIGYGVFALLYGLMGWQWWAAKIVADLTGWTVNYLIQRYGAFRRESRAHKNSTLFARFSFISLVNVPIDYAIVGGLKWLGVSPFVGLWISSLFFTGWKYAWYKWWVFRAPRK